MEIPAVATPIEAPCENSNTAACDTTISPADTPKPKLAHNVTIAGRNVASLAACSGVILSSGSRLGSANGSSKPPLFSNRKRRGAHASSKNPMEDMAYLTPPESSKHLTIGANRNAPAARADVTSPTLNPSPKGAAVEICTDKPYPTPAAPPKSNP
tara:strand:- start:2298 stop:2765 length:468 start_codon:yes stop_codon:yes gene_type:complete